MSDQPREHKKIIFQTFATLAKAESMSDGGYNLKMHTQELNDETQIVMLGKATRQFGYLAFIVGESKLDPESLEIPEVKPEFPTDKSPSQRLRAVLFRVWEQQGAKGSFDEFYRTKMNDLCEFLKDKYLN